MRLSIKSALVMVAIGIIALRSASVARQSDLEVLRLALGVYLTCRFRLSEALAICAAGRDAASIPTGGR